MASPVPGTATVFEVDDDIFNDEPTAGPATPRALGPPPGAQWDNTVINPNMLLFPAGPPIPVPRVPPRAKKVSPTEEDLKDCNNVLDLFAWAGFKGADDNIAVSLLAKLNQQPEDPIDEFAAIDPDDFLNDLQTWKID